MRIWKMKKAIPLAVATLAIGGVIAGVTAVASAAPPPSPGSCPSGYVSAYANNSYAGSGAGGGTARGSVSAPLTNEIMGVGCLKANSSKAHLKFKWATTGKLQEGIFYYELVDCGTNLSVGTKSLGYPTGTAKKSGSSNASFKIVKGKKYKMRISGGGTYRRLTNIGTLGSVGKFYALKGEGAVPWKNESKCVTAK